MSTGHLDVTIMGREYRVACGPEEQVQLMRVVALVDGKMTEIAGRTRNAIPERVAVMAAMSIAHELLARPDAKAEHREENSVVPSVREEGVAPVTQEVHERLNALMTRIDDVLQETATVI